MTYILHKNTDSILAEPTPGDVWLLASAMQKAIRRGEHQRAHNAGYALWLKDRRRFWYRLLIISMEDVGIGNTDTLVQVLTGIASTSWRRQVGDDQAGLQLIRLLCCAVKSRLIDSVYIQAQHSPAYQAARMHYAQADDDALTAAVADTASPLVQRAIAIWLLAGTKKYSSDHMPTRIGGVDKAVTALRSLSAHAPLIESCIGVISRLPYPLALHIPLIWQEAQRHTVIVQHNIIPLAPDIEGMPVYAVDGFTRVGKACFRELQRAVPTLKAFTTQQIALGVFYLDGGLVDRELTAPGLAAIQDAGEQTDLTSAGLGPSGYSELQQTLRENMGLLTDIRQRRLKEHLQLLRSEGGL